MSDFMSAADQAMGLELQLEEVVEQRERAVAQGFTDEVTQLSTEVAELHNQLADAAEVAASEPAVTPPTPVIHEAAQLDVDREPT
jgi:hypothetical protein